MTDKDEQTHHTSTAGVMASAMFHVVTGQTPEHFAHGMWEKARSISIDPILHIYGPDGMLERAANKAVDKVTGVDKPDTAYVSKEEHAAYLGDIIAVGAALFPGLGEAVAPAGPQRAMVTPEGAVLHPPAEPSPPVLMAEKARGAGEAPAPKEGPGRWTNDLTAGENMKPDAAKYQEQISGHKAAETYHLNGRAFDGFRPGANGEKGTLLDAKNLGDDGRFVKAYENMLRGNYSDFPHLYERATNILEEARGQVRAAEGTGLRIEWDVSSKKGAEAIQTLFDHDAELKGRITVEHVPMKTEPTPSAPGGDKAAAAAPKPEQPAAPKPETPPPSKPETPATPKPEPPQSKPAEDPSVPRPRG